MLRLVDVNDHRAVRNLNNIVDLHEVMINQRRPAEAVAQFLDPGYIQHDPLLSTGAEGLSSFFDNALKDRPHARWVGHRIIAVDDYVWVHSNFLNLFNDDPDDTGIAGADIFKMNAEGKAIEHWEVLQIVGTPENAAPWFAPDLPAANKNGLF
ncbi:nuclear transport factor 2 family protein [Streptomyces canus]|uniref:nuclear transport factor 2 family protein n=1 Tax=Streptomyces canus TaxID=58343 RepID=UPI002E2F64EC|nr:nuclear transport factor 2 family protein [Streptomyces canus]